MGPRMWALWLFGVGTLKGTYSIGHRRYIGISGLRAHTGGPGFQPQNLRVPVGELLKCIEIDSSTKLFAVEFTVDYPKAPSSSSGL